MLVKDEIKTTFGRAAAIINKHLHSSVKVIASDIDAAPRGGEVIILSNKVESIRPYASDICQTAVAMDGTDSNKVKLQCLHFLQEPEDLIKLYNQKEWPEYPDQQDSTCDLCSGKMVEMVRVVNRQGKPSAIIGACDTCTTTRHLLLPTLTWLNDFYLNHWDQAHREVHPNRGSNPYIYDICSKRIPQGGKILDIGCGFGDKLKPFADDGFEVFGADPAEHRARHIKDVLKYNAINAPIEKLLDNEVIQKGGPFDLVYMFHVLEHIRKPLKALEVLYELTNEDGHIFLGFPNYWGESLFQATMFSLHTHSFSPWSTKLMLAASGFEIVHEENSYRKINVLARKVKKKLSQDEIIHMARENSAENIVKTVSHFFDVIGVNSVDTAASDLLWGVSWNPFGRKAVLGVDEGHRKALVNLQKAIASGSKNNLLDCLPCTLMWDREAAPIWVK